jgi:hypothetical protein
MSDAKYGKGFAFRMTILLGLLALVGAGFYYDRFVLAPQTQAKINDAFTLMTKDGEVSKKEVAEKIGFAPSKVEKQDDYEIETYQFSRALPLIKGDYLSVIYENDSLVNILHNKPYDADAVKNEVKFTPPKGEYKGNYPNVAGGGGPPPGGDASGDDEEEDESADDEANEDKDNGDNDKDEDKEGDGA